MTEDHLNNRGHKRDHSANESNALALVMANTRIAELKFWYKAAKGEPMTTDYRALRSACQKILPFVGMSRAMLPRLCELTPILLGARAFEQPDALGWYGRLALRREDGGTRQTPGRNENWDTGVSFGNAAQHFVHPTIKLQSKETNGRHSLLYKAGHVEMLVAKRYGLERPVAIMLGCLLENDQVLALPERHRQTPFDTANLNRLTDRLRDGLQDFDAFRIASQSS